MQIAVKKKIKNVLKHTAVGGTAWFSDIKNI